VALVGSSLTLYPNEEVADVMQGSRRTSIGPALILGVSKCVREASPRLDHLEISRRKRDAMDISQELSPWA
jgi:hypothetical protein